MSHKKESVVLEIFHGLLILVAYASPFWIDWRVVVAGSLVLLLQYAVFKTCIINKYQYKNTEDTYYSRNLRRFNIPHDPVRVKRFFRYYLLFIIPLVAIFWQLALRRVVMVGF